MSTVSEGRVPPNELDSEASVLGGIILSNVAINEVLERGVVAEDFYHPAHRAIFEVMVDLDSKGQPIDLVTVPSALKSGDATRRVTVNDATLAELANRVPTAANIGFYAKKVKEASALRRVITASGEITGKAFARPGDVPEFLDWAERRLGEAAENQTRRSFTPVKQIVGDVAASITKRAEEKNAVTGVTTGFVDLDKFTAGLQPSDLILLAARPSMGKSALALNILRNAALAGIPSLLFSLEMSKESCTERLVCIDGRIDGQATRTGRLSNEEWGKLPSSIGNVSVMDIDIDDSSALTLMEVRAKARRWKRMVDAKAAAEPRAEADEKPKKKGGIIVIDYLQLMAGASDEREESREREVANISKGLKALAKELELPVLALSQLNRKVEERRDKHPMMSDLRESGSLEQDADLIMFIYRACKYEEDKKDDKTAEVIIGKQRNGPTGTANLLFQDFCGRFENLEQRDDRYNY